MPRPLIILFAKAPLPGRVKTRLCPPLSPDEASRLHSAFVCDAGQMLATLVDEADIEISSDSATEAWPCLQCPRSVQVAGDLGTRLFHALDSALSSGREIAMVMGSDSPGLPAGHVRALVGSAADVSLGPTADGGFFAIACRKVHAKMFEGVRWSVSQTFDDTASAISRCGLRVNTGPSWFDVDVPEDLLRMLVMPDLPANTAQWVNEYRRRRAELT